MENALAIEEFVQALTTQLDRAQAAMAMKARNMDLPLTFAVKDLSLDIRSHIVMEAGRVLICPAGPGEREASIIRLSLTTITRPMIEENATEFQVEPDDVTIREALGDELTEEEQRRLEWAGIHTISQLDRARVDGGEEMLQKVSNLPVDRLRAALSRASRPLIDEVVRENPTYAVLPKPVRPEIDVPYPLLPESRPVKTETTPSRFGTDRDLIRIRGRNLFQREIPQVKINNQPVRVIASNRKELVVDPEKRILSGVLSVETAPGLVAEYRLDEPPATAPERMAEVDEM